VEVAAFDTAKYTAAGAAVKHFLNPELASQLNEQFGEQGNNTQKESA
jgi:hypothetical protein